MPVPPIPARRAGGFSALRAHARADLTVRSEEGAAPGWGIISTPLPLG